MASRSVLIYDESAGKLWEAGQPPASTPVHTDASAAAPQGDVLAQVPPTDDIVHLERLWRLRIDSSPLELLLLWQQTDKVDQYLRCFLLDFGHRVLAAERAQPR